MPSTLPRSLMMPAMAFNGAVVVPVRIDHAVRRRVAEHHPALAFKPRDGFAVGDVIALAVRDRHADHLPGIIAAGKRRIRALDPQIDVAADEAKLRVAHQHARQQAGLRRRSESRCRSPSTSPPFCSKATHRVHDRRAGGDRAAAQIIAVGKAAGDDDEIGAGRQLGFRVPDHRRLAPGDEPQRARHIALAIDSRKMQHRGFHRAPDPDLAQPVTSTR